MKSLNTFLGGFRSRIPRPRKMLRDRYLELANTYNLADPDDIYKEEWYENMDGEIARNDVSEVVETLQSEFSPNSVIDIGCGVGLTLRAFKQSGVEDVFGVDGASYALQHRVADWDEIDQHDLRERFYPTRNYDLVICFEVGEHLPERYSDRLVDSVTRCAETVAFTAATPGQGGTHHINEQPREYWIEKFEERNFDYQEDLTRELASEMQVAQKTWIPENLFIFQR